MEKFQGDTIARWSESCSERVKGKLSLPQVEYEMKKRINRMGDNKRNK